MFLLKSYETAIYLISLPKQSVVKIIINCSLKCNRRSERDADTSKLQYFPIEILLLIKMKAPKEKSMCSLVEQSILIDILVF